MESNKDQPVERSEKGRTEEGDQRQKTGAGGEIKKPHLCSCCSLQLISATRIKRSSECSQKTAVVFFLLVKDPQKGAKMRVGEHPSKGTT